MMHAFSSRCFGAAEDMIRGTGLRRSRLGRSVVAGLNAVGQFGLAVYFEIKRRPMRVQGQQIDCRVGAKGSFRSTLELVLDRYEPETTKLFRRLLQPGMTVMDIGAHAGYFSLIGASCVGPAGTVYAFEPFPASFQHLQRNIALNGYKNIHAVRKAVSDKTGVHKLLVNPKGSDRNSLFAGEIPWEADSPEVETTRLDDFLEACGWPRVDLIKMDIEGAEHAALAGMKQTFEKCGVRHIITEFSPPSLRAAGCDPQEFLQELADAGFSLYTIEGEVEPKPLNPSGFSGLIQILQDRGGTNLLCENAQLTRRGNQWVTN
ncbi:MAG: FkbM family methyltransferase [Candidatus Acidiferrum sp.]